MKAIRNLVTATPKQHPWLMELNNYWDLFDLWLFGVEEIWFDPYKRLIDPGMGFSLSYKDMDSNTYHLRITDSIAFSQNCMTDHNDGTINTNSKFYENSNDLWEANIRNASENLLEHLLWVTDKVDRKKITTFLAPHFDKFEQVLLQRFPNFDTNSLDVQNIYDVHQDMLTEFPDKFGGGGTCLYMDENAYYAKTFLAKARKYCDNG